MGFLKLHKDRWGSSLGKTYAAEPDDLSFLPDTHMMQGEKQLTELSSDFHLCAANPPPSTQIPVIQLLNKVS